MSVVVNNELKVILNDLIFCQNIHQDLTLQPKQLDLLLDYIITLDHEINIYELRHLLALKKLNSAMKHYKINGKNNAIVFTKEILEGKGIEEKCYKFLRGVSL